MNGENRIWAVGVLSFPFDRNISKNFHFIWHLVTKEGSRAIRACIPGGCVPANCGVYCKSVKLKACNSCHFDGKLAPELSDAKLINTVSSVDSFSGDKDSDSGTGTTTCLIKLLWGKLFFQMDNSMKCFTRVYNRVTSTNTPYSSQGFSAVAWTVSPPNLTSESHMTILWLYIRLFFVFQVVSFRPCSSPVLYAHVFCIRTIYPTPNPV